MSLGSMSVGYNTPAQMKQLTEVELFWKDFYTRMVPRKNILGEHGVKFYLDKNTSLSKEEKEQILADAKKIQNSEPNAKPYYYGGKRRKTRRGMKKRRVTKKHHRKNK